MNGLQRDYPQITFRKEWKLTDKSLLFLGQCEAYINAIANTPILPHHYQDLMNVALVKGAQATTAIEGNTLSDQEIQKMMEGEKLPPSKEYQEIEVRNILEAFQELFNELVQNNVDHFISIDLLKRFHKLVGKDLNEHFSAIPGQLRNSDVVVGRYRCPDYRDIPILLDSLCKWLRSEFKYKEKDQSLSDIIVQAIVTHVYIEWIHPFGDGNGRTGRLVEFYILMRGGIPDIASHILSNYYNLTRTEYYRQIELATSKRDLTEFIQYALLGFRDGLEHTLETIQESQFETTWHKYIYDKFDQIRSSTREDVFKRQRNLALEIPVDRQFSVNQVPDLSIQLAKTYSNISEKTLVRDISKLVELDIVKKIGERYKANSEILSRMIAKRKSVATHKII